MDGNQTSARGFTLIELTIATVFVGFIITILAATTTNVIRSYNKGIWLAQINVAGQQLNADIGDKARYSGAAMVNNSARRLCLGGVSYLWNTQTQRDRNAYGNNVYTNDKPFSLVRIIDPNAQYCVDVNKRVKTNDNDVRVLLGTGAVIQEFTVRQGIAGDSSIPLLSVQSVISTEGSNRPIRAYIDSSNVPTIDEDGTKGGTWQCGEWIDNNKNRIPDSGDKFTPASNQYCSFAKYDITVYERSREK